MVKKKTRKRTAKRTTKRTTKRRSRVGAYAANELAKEAFATRKVMVEDVLKRHEERLDYLSRQLSAQASNLAAFKAEHATHSHEVAIKQISIQASGPKHGTPAWAYGG